MEHPKSLEVCTIGVPDAYRGETVKTFVVVKPGQTLTVDEVVAFCKERLAPYKVPKLVEFIDALPKSAVGKILRRELQDLEAKKQA
jgi:long-chain acyl-CoA synthetase